MRFQIPGQAWLVTAALLAGCGGGSSNEGGSTPPPPAQPDFSISAPTTVTVTPNSTQTISISVVPENGFTAQVSVSLSGLPAGVTASPATFSLIPSVSGQHVSSNAIAHDATPGSSQTVVITANAGATAGPVSLTITATSGTITHVETLATSDPDFALAADNSSIALTAGSTAEISVSADALNGFSDAVAVSLSGLPAGVTVSPSNLSLTPGTGQMFTLTAASSVGAGSVALTLQGTSGALAHNLDLTLAIAAAPPPVDFSLSLTPGTLTLVAGGSAGQVSLSATAINGFTGPIAITMSGLPSGVVAMPSSFTLNPGIAQPISFTAASSDAASTSTLTLNAIAAGLAHSTSLTLTIAAPAPDFTLQVAPGTLTLNPGAPAQTVSVTASALNGFTGQVQVALSGLPANVTVSPTSLTLTPGTAQTVSVTAGSNATAGSGTLHLTGTSGTITHTASVGLTITAATPDFVLSVGPTSINSTPGPSSQPLEIVAQPINGFNEPIDVTISGLPSTVNWSGGSIPLSPGIPQQTEFASNPSNAAASSLVTVTATSASVTHSAQFTLNVAADTAPDFSLSILPTGVLLPPGNTQLVIEASGSGGLSGPVAVQLTDLPAGVTADFASGDLQVNGNLTVNLTVPTGTPQTSGLIRLQGSAAGLTHETDAGYTVVPGPGLDIFLGPSVLTLNQGQTANLILGMESTAGGTITTNSNTSLPTGVTSPFFGTNGFSLAGNVVGSTYIPFTAAVDAPVGQTTLIFNSTDGVNTRTSQVVLNLVSEPDFNISASNSPLTVAAGGSTTVSIGAGAIDGFGGSVTFQLTASNGITLDPATFTTIPGPGNAQQITLSASPAATSGQISIQATSGSLSHSLQIPVNILSVAPSMQVPGSIALGGSAVSGAVATTTYPGTLTESWSGFPDGLLIAYGSDVNAFISLGPPSTSTVCGPNYSSNGGTSDCNEQLVFELLYNGAAAGTYPLTLTVTFTPDPGSTAPPGTVTQTYQVPLIVTPPDFTTSSSPTSLSIAPGGTQSFTITATPLTSGTLQSVSFSIPTELPSGITLTEEPLTQFFSQTYTISASADAPAVSTTLSITATSQTELNSDGEDLMGSGPTHTIQIPVTIGTPP